MNLTIHPTAKLAPHPPTPAPEAGATTRLSRAAGEELS